MAARTRKATERSAPRSRAAQRAAKGGGRKSKATDAAPTPAEEPRKWRTVESLTCRLTSVEVGERGVELAQKMHERALVEEALADAKRTAKERIERLDAEIGAFGTEVRTATTVRPIEVEHCEDFATNTVRSTRTDTGELLRSRPMSAEERQRALFPHEANRAGDVAGDATEHGDDGAPPADPSAADGIDSPAAPAATEESDGASPEDAPAGEGGA